MIKSRHIIRLVTILAALCLLFSISSFADGYSFQNDGDQWNQRFSGTNKVYTDGIYVGEMGAIDAYMDNYGNTYNGTNIIDATAYPGAGQDDESTYNGTLSVTANDIISSKTTVDDATVNAATTVTVNEVLSDNNLNAGVQFNNSSFNNDVTISGSGAISFDGATVNNVSIGSTEQAASIVTNTANTKNILALLYGNLGINVISSSNSYTFTLYNQSYTIPLTNSFFSGTYYANYRGQIGLALFTIMYHLTNQVSTDTTVDQPTYRIITVNGFPVFLFRSYMDSYSYDSNTDVISTSRQYNYYTFLGFLRNYFFVTINTYLKSHVQYIADTFYRWYNPNISLANSKFWKAYNTDTGQYDDVNLSTVLAYITWYLGQLYNDGTNVTQNMEDMTDNINTAASTFQDMEQKEQAAINQITQGFETFLPDVNTFSSFRAITWCSNYLQQIYLSLGSYGTVIFIALLFGVCLQFIGYFRYK